MPCAAGEVCTIPSLSPESSDDHACSGGYGGRLHGFCGEVKEPDGDNSVHRICHACADAKSSTKDAVKASAGKRSSTDKEDRAAGPCKSATSGSGKTDESTSRTRLTPDHKLEVLQRLDQGVAHNSIASRFKCGLHTAFRVQDERRPLYYAGAGSKPKRCRWRRRLRSRQPQGKVDPDGSKDPAVEELEKALNNVSSRVRQADGQG